MIKMLRARVGFQYGKGGTASERRAYKKLVKDMPTFFSKLQVRSGYALGSLMRRKK